MVLAAFGQYQRLWTFVGQRDYEAVVKGVVVSTLVIVGAIALPAPGHDHAQRVGQTHSPLQSAVTCPAA